MRIIKLFSFALVFIIFTSFIFPQELKVRIIKKGAVLRLLPKEDSTVIKDLPLGAELVLLETIEDWVKIKLPPDKDGFEVTGYVHFSYLYEKDELNIKPPEIQEKVEEVEITPPEKPEIVDVELDEDIPPFSKKKPRVGLGLLIGHTVPTEKIYVGGVCYGGNLQIGIGKHFGVEIAGLRYQFEIEGSTNSLSDGELSITPIFISLMGKFYLSERFNPNIFGGVGYYYNKFSINEEIPDKWNSVGMGITEEVENTVGFQFGIGLNIFATNNVAISGDVRYCIASTKGSWTFTNTILNSEVSGDFDDIDLNSLILGFGIKIFF